MSPSHLQLCICICVDAYLCICNGWLDAVAMFVESLPHLKVAQHCVAAFPNIVSPTYYHSMTHVIQYLKLEHAMRRDSRRVTHTTLDTIWNRLVSNQMSYSCPIHTEKRGNCKFGLNYQIVGALPKPSRKLYFQVRTNLGPADHVNDLIAGSPGRRWPLNGGVMHFRASPHLSRGWAGDSWWMRTVWWLSRWWGAARSTHQDHPSSVEDNGRWLWRCRVVEFN